nr:FAD-dependent oxidoreductase [Salinibacter ruber]
MVEGTQALHERLAATLPDAALRRRHRLRSLRRTGASVQATAQTPNGPQTTSVDAVVLAVPPRLAGHTLQFEPALPDALASALRGTTTWMSPSAKAAVTYARPFWREQGLAGRVRSAAGPVHDWHDATPPAGPTPGPHTPPDPAPILQRPHWEGRLHVAAAETATEHPGYLDGAIEAGRRAARALA